MDSSRKNILILLLVSDPDIRAVMREALSNAGYLVQTSADLGEAVDRLHAATPNLLIVRPFINSMPGHEAAQYLRTKCYGLRVLMVGGLINDSRIMNRESLKNIHVFPKPYSEDELLGAVEEALTTTVH